MGKSKKHQPSLPCHHHLSRTYAYAATHLRPRRCASVPTPLRIRATTLTHLRHHTHAPTPIPLRICDTTLAHPHTYSHAPTTPLARICDTTRTQPPHRSHAPSSSIYTHWRPPLRTFVLPCLFRSLSESIRIYPSLSDILREISMGPD